MKTLFGLLALSVVSAAFGQEQGPCTVPGLLLDQKASDGIIGNRIALHKGDLLTIVVSESSSGSTTASTNSSKKDATQVNASVLPVLQSLTTQFGGTLGSILNSPFQGASTGVSSSTAGSGSSTQSTSFNANVTVKIKDVLPNGNFEIEGRREIKMNKQTQTILLEGTVRRDDISVNNTILSQNVADLRLEAEGKGLIANRQREGLLTKIISWVF